MTSVTVESPNGPFTAYLWYKNGDHPNDYATPVEGFENGELTTFSPKHQKANDWEGQIVRRYRNPHVPGETTCTRCGETMHVHGWIDNESLNGIIVCPGTYVGKKPNGEYVCIDN